MLEMNVGAPRSRVDGRMKVTGQAPYAAEFTPHDLAHGVVVSSTIARGRILSIDTQAAEAVPGVIQVFTHANRPPAAKRDKPWRDEVAPPGHPLRPLEDERIHHSGQPIALVVAEDLEIARHAAALLRVTYEAEEHGTDLAARQAAAYEPPEKRSGMAPPKPRGDAETAFGMAPVKHEAAYRIPDEYHNPMEMHATTVVWDGDGAITVHDKTQGVMNTQGFLAGVFGLKAENVRVVAPFVGGAFGAALRPQHQCFLAAMAALALKRSVRVELTRRQMFSFTHRPDGLQDLALASDEQGRLQAVRHEVIGATSDYEDYQEAIVSWSSGLYRCENVATRYRLVKLDIATPGDMRAPGAPTGLFALESGMDELAQKLGMDPLQLRLANYADTDPDTGHAYTSKELRAAYQIGAERFGWSRRNPEPRAMKDGHELIGWGMASGIWEASMQKTAARATLHADGHLEVATASADIGTGTYTILAQVAADALGVPMERVTVQLGDTSLPPAPVEGGSWGAASGGNAVQAACVALREKLFRAARRMEGSPLANASIERVVFRDGRIALAQDPSAAVTLAQAMQAAGLKVMEAEEAAAPSKLTMLRYAAYTHSAVFAEVRVDEELGVIRVTRLVNAVAAGRILNPKTARSQILGGLVFGMGMALHEEALRDHRLGRVMNSNFAEYHIPAHADVQGLEVIFVDEHDEKINPMGVKGLGEIGVVGTAAAIANAVHHATGRRVRELPITLDKLL